ncbi:IclR family transcriptional regulator [Amycolatopsis jejuensis]|uniref:IclR family transcriptional regulator n=1 Tax=Amycolatopsis jejuensis TaxID=330084 RepID=UPI000689B92D|nr:IclR family transcriptional regulator [Amycolatopsis jejuensis]
MTTAEDARPRGERRSQTLERGLAVLDLLRGGPHTVQQVADALSLNRSVVYRLLLTLQDRRLAVRDSEGRFRLGSALLEFVRAFEGDLQRAAHPHVSSLAEELDATAAISIEEESEAVCVMSVQPRSGSLHVALPVGFRHPLSRGSDGLALLSSRPPLPGERPEVALARERGYAVSSGEMQQGVVSMSAPVAVPFGNAPAVVSVLLLTTSASGQEAVAEKLVAVAQQISASFG